jgi:SAM-dependent methyltransferase
MAGQVIAFEWSGGIEDPEQAGQYLEYLDLTNPVFANSREQTFRALEGITGLGVEVGSGAGHAAHDMHVRGFRVVGVDPTELFVKSSKRRFPCADYRVGSACALPFDDGAMAFYRAERVWLNLPDPASAAAEAWRVLAPGAPIVLSDPDVRSIVVPCGHDDLVRVAVAGMDANLPHGRPNPPNADLLVDAGFDDVAVRAVAHTIRDVDVANGVFLDRAFARAHQEGKLSGNQVGAIRNDLRARHERGTFAFAFLSIITTARRP